MNKTLVNTNTIVPEGWPRVGGASSCYNVKVFFFFLIVLRENTGVKQNVGILIQKTGRCNENNKNIFFSQKRLQRHSLVRANFQVHSRCTGNKL